MIKPLILPEYNNKICRYILDLGNDYGKINNDENLLKIDTIKKYLNYYLYRGDFNLLMHMQYTIYTDLDIISRSIKHIGLYATKELFDIVKCTEIKIGENKYIISMTLYHIIYLLTMNPIKSDDKLYNELIGFLIRYVPKELYDMTDLNISNRVIKLKDPLDGTYKTHDDIFFVDDLNTINDLIIRLKSDYKQVNSNMALSKIIRMTTRIRIDNINPALLILINSNKSATYTVGSDGMYTYIYLTMNLSDYANMFADWRSYISDGSISIPLMYYCLINEHELFDIIKIKDKTVEDDLITYLQSKPY